MTRQLPTFEVQTWRGRTARWCVVIPVIDEGERFTRLLARMSALALPADVIITDGGSRDGSLDALDPVVRGVLVKTGPGRLGAQLRVAYAFALDQGYHGVVTIDGNGKDDPEGIPRVLDALAGGYDLVQASRFVPGGVAENTPILRTIAIRGVHAPLLRLSSSYPWTDTTQGFRGYSRTLLEHPRIDLFRDVFDGYELLPYVSRRAPLLGLRCTEVPSRRSYPAGAIPTKIRGIRGNLDVLGALLGAVSGRYDP